MKKHLVFAAAFALVLCACKNEKPADDISETDTLQVTAPVAKKDNVAVKKDLALLINKTISWASYDEGITVLPTLEKDSVYTGFDFAEHTKNLDKLRASGFFEKGFINNYDKIIKELDRKIKAKEFDTWLVGDLPPFSFANDADPWCNCQDDPGDWNTVRVGVNSLNADAGKFFYYFGNGEPKADEYNYKFDAVKENGQWKITYMEGFDYDRSIKPDGEL